jgi:Lecithin retinol acyltransferase
VINYVQKTHGVLILTMFFEAPYREAIPGQWIRSWNGVVWHHGIVVEPSLDPVTNTWSIMVAHTTLRHGRVVVTPLDGFGHRIEIVAQPNSLRHQQLILATAYANIGKPYALLNSNCEHFASHCYKHKAESRQVQNAVVVLGLAGTAALVMNSSRS